MLSHPDGSWLFIGTLYNISIRLASVIRSCESYHWNEQSSHIWLADKKMWREDEVIRNLRVKTACFRLSVVRDLVNGKRHLMTSCREENYKKKLSPSIRDIGPIPYHCLHAETFRLLLNLGHLIVNFVNGVFRISQKLELPKHKRNRCEFDSKQITIYDKTFL